MPQNIGKHHENFINPDPDNGGFNWMTRVYFPTDVEGKYVPKEASGHADTREEAVNAANETAASMTE